MLELLEPWCDNLYSDFVGHKGMHVNKYVEEEPTSFDLKKRLHSDHINPIDGVVVRFDASKLTQENFKVIEVTDLNNLSAEKVVERLSNSLS